MLQSKVRIGDARRDGASGKRPTQELLARGISDFQSERQEELGEAAQEATSIERDIRELLSQLAEVRQAIGQKLESAQQDLDAAKAGQCRRCKWSGSNPPLRHPRAIGCLGWRSMVERDLALDLELAPLGFDPVGNVDDANQAREQFT